MRRFLSWALPGGLVFAASLALGLGPEDLVQRASRVFPWFVYGGAALLAGVAHRSRVVALVVGLGALEATAATGTGGPSALYFAGALFALAVAVLAPLGDRGVASTVGLLHVGGMVVLAVLGGILLHVAPRDLDAFLAFRFPLSGATSWCGVAHPVQAALVLAITISLVLGLRREGSVGRGLFWSAVLVGSALCVAEDPGRSSVLLMGAGLALGLSVLDPSSAWAYRDDLTGLPGRRALARDLEAMRGTFSMAVVDIDDFRRFNDQYGHDVGDQVLRMVASRLTKVPGGGRAYRHGGEEFALLFPGTTQREALHHLQGFRRSLEESPFGLRRWRRPRGKPADPGSLTVGGGRPAKHLSVSVSVGAADSTGADSSPEAVLRRADQAVHHGKSTAEGQAEP